MIKLISIPFFAASIPLRLSEIKEKIGKEWKIDIIYQELMPRNTYLIIGQRGPQNDVIIIRKTKNNYITIYMFIKTWKFIYMCWLYAFAINLLSW